MIIGICGGSGAGKTTLLERLKTQYKELNPSVFSMDNYYLPIEKQAKDDQGEYNFDLPTALDKDKLIADLTELVNGNTIRVKEYHFNAPPDLNSYVDITPSELIIVEGLFLFEYSEVAQLLDFSIFIELNLEEQLKRRILRDQKTRGYSKQEIIYQWDQHVMPCYEKYLLPFKANASFTYRNNEFADKDFSSLVKTIDSKIS